MQATKNDAARAGAPHSASFASVALNITSRCNLLCLHCYNRSGDALFQDMDREMLFRCARQVAALRPHNICICGGEPLCRPELFELLDFLRPYSAKLSMVTNGFAVDAKTAKALVSHGLDAVQVSLDGAYAWQHDSLRGIAGSFNRAKNAIRFFREAGIAQVMTSILPNRLNAGSLSTYVKLCMELGVDIIRSMPFLPSGRGYDVGRSLMLDEMGYFRFCRELLTLFTLYGGRIRIEWDDPLALITDMAARAEQGEIEAALEIRADGQVALSSYLPILLGDCSKLASPAHWQKIFSHACRDERVRAYIGRIHNIYDFDCLDPLPYGDEVIQLNLLEEEL